jgi:hypothetical protein
MPDADVTAAVYILFTKVDQRAVPAICVSWTSTVLALQDTQLDMVVEPSLYPGIWLAMLNKHSDIMQASYILKIRGEVFA